MFRRKKLLIVLVVFAIVTGLTCWQRKPLLGWYYFRQASQAKQTERADWVQRLVGLDTAALGQALDRLGSADSTDCELAEAVLGGLARNWHIADDRAQTLLEQLSTGFASFSEAGKDSAMKAACALLEKGDRPPDTMCKMGSKLLQQGAADLRARASVLRLAGLLAEHRAADGSLIRELATQGIKATDAPTRAIATRLFLEAPLNDDAALLADIVPLLRDSSSLVRRAALLVVAGKRDLVDDDSLLPLLHDEDAQVGSLCEDILRSRGLKESHLMLARLISDASPSARLAVVQHLTRARDLDPVVWLKRLCQDPSPAVRAAAIRASADQTHVDLLDQLVEMSRNDPSPTVRQLAVFYVQRAQK